jgi:hypothetical protein
MRDTTPYSAVLVRLLKGPLYEESRQEWDLLLRYRGQVEDWFAHVSLEVVIAEHDGLSFLRRRREHGDAEGTRSFEAQALPVPELVARRELPYRLSLLCVLLAEELYRFGSSRADESRLVLSRQRIRDLILPFLPKTTNEAKLFNDIDVQVNKLVDYGFLRPLSAGSEELEVMRLLKYKIGPEVLKESLDRLSDYAKSIALEAGNE